MTDVFIAYAREDRPRVRILSDMLRLEGWDVWVDPTERAESFSAAIDVKLATAGAVLVVWTKYSRNSAQVLQEAATGLSKNKLIQVRLDESEPPPPFDVPGSATLAAWGGERGDPEWRGVLSAIRLYSGAPGSTRLQPSRRFLSSPGYLEPRRTLSLRALAATGVLAAAGLVLYALKPLAWSTHQPASPAPEAAEPGRTARWFEDADVSYAEWTKVNRDAPESLRRFIAAYPDTPSADAARALLRVQDARAWVRAVTSDTETSYNAYLTAFPANAPIPGNMSAAARDRLSSIGAERAQAIADIQRGLFALGIYEGQIDGVAGAVTSRSISQFAANQKQRAPSLAKAAPRELRAFADLIQQRLARGPEEIRLTPAALRNAEAISSPAE